ncbi:glycine-rich domain-containing protein [Flavobacterium sp. 3HN19-14]|uniref:glycine-rich domain-containing protein n=1 Tax=Flavobacterium sp. 3HN19-14 TaxID=3448133 RepID=UPI003EE01CDD
MDKELWAQIAAFDFDKPLSPLGFSARLSKENFWTTDFTKNAIIEYKKFMYLAAVSENMVSPSEIVDTVWHEHLVFTQSYNEFCTILKKRIAHIPSTHRKEEFEKFRIAKDFTMQQYEAFFGKQPRDYWFYNDIFASLQLEKAKFKIRTFLLLGIFAFFALWIPAYYLLFPVYIQINNPLFLKIYVTVFVAAIFLLEIYNRSKLNAMLYGIDRENFIFKLSPNEMIYLKYGSIEEVVHGNVDKMIRAEKIVLTDKKQLQMSENASPANPIEGAIADVIDHSGIITYKTLIRHIKLKPALKNIVGTIDALRKYFIKSKLVGKVFYQNFCVLALILLLGLVRLSTGVMREKPVTYIALLLLLFFAIIVFFLARLLNIVGSKLIPDFYKNEIIKVSGRIEASEWGYFMMGNTIYIASFLAVMNDFRQNGDGSGSGCGGGGSSCGGGSCGGGCGGCGGGD